MRKLIVLLWALGSFVLGYAQTEANPVKWNFSSKSIGENQYELTFTASILKHWHIYDLNPTEDAEKFLPIATAIEFTPASSYQLIGKLSGSKPIAHREPSLDVTLYYHENQMVLKQKVKLKEEKSTKIKVMISYQACIEENGSERCNMPQDEIFEVTVGEDAVQGEQSLTSVGVDTTGKKVIEAKSNDPFNWDLDPSKPLDNCEIEEEEQTMWWAFLQGLFWGLFALLTPCVFPMIPLTVSFFTKSAGSGSGKSKAVLYGLFILLTYVAVSIPFHIVSSTNPAMFNEFATNPWINIAFFVIFIVFAISFFGFYEITLPNSWANKMDSASNIGGILGVFFMAITLVIVSFSCTGPILGGMLGQIYASNAQGTVDFLGMSLSLAPTKLTAATAGFGIALGLPFGLFAFFPSLMKSLPRSGGWLEDFKVSLGFLEVALAIKFVSNADLVQQWGLLKRETFFALWIIVGTLWTLYLLGKFKFKPYQGSQTLSKTKLFFAITIGLFTLRIIPGVLPPSHLNEFRFLSGFPPPSSYSFYPHEEEFKIYKDLKEAMAVAKKENKPLFVDFTGWACVNCRKMEETVWVDDEIKQILKEKYIMVSLYVDEKIELPKDQQFVYKSGNLVREIKTVGNKWATLQAETFNNQAQPFYVVLAPDSTLLIPSEDYNPRVKEYAKWLNCGVNAFGTWQSSTAPKAP
jgi:thiol:disulfide interchange protein DsbD